MRCDECMEDVESVGHILWSCSWAEEVWQCTKLRFHFDQSQVTSFHDLLWQIMMSNSHKEKDMNWWWLWHGRCGLIVMRFGMAEERRVSRLCSNGLVNIYRSFKKQTKRIPFQWCLRLLGSLLLQRRGIKLMSTTQSSRLKNLLVWEWWSEIQMGKLLLL